jgi:hypothetical protein
VTVTTPPRRPATEQDRDLARRVAELEALIEEARRRARRRRMRNVAALVVAVSSLVSAFPAARLTASHGLRPRRSLPSPP